MKVFLKALLCIILTVSLWSCDNNDDDKMLYFIGDSIVARWDLSESFPSRRTENLGKSRAGIDYLESFKGRFVSKTVVLMIGTNNSNLMTVEERDAFADRYIDAIEALGAERVYLYSILPRDFASDPDDINDDVEAFNSIISTRVKSIPGIVYIDAYDRFFHNGKLDSQMLNDGLHLSQYGYEILTYLLIKEL